MGILGSLFGWDKSLGALNAVLASNLLELSSASTRQEVARGVVKIISNVQQRKTLEQILQGVTEENRSVQMNFVALACDNLGIEPPYPGNVWTRFDNPYLVGNKVDQIRVSAALGAIKKESGGRAKWPGNGVRVDFSRLYNDGQLTNLS